MTRFLLLALFLPLSSAQRCDVTKTSYQASQCCDAADPDALLTSEDFLDACRETVVDTVSKNDAISTFDAFGSTYYRLWTYEYVPKTLGGYSHMGCNPVGQAIGLTCEQGTYGPIIGKEGGTSRRSLHMSAYQRYIWKDNPLFAPITRCLLLGGPWSEPTDTLEFSFSSGTGVVGAACLERLGVNFAEFKRRITAVDTYVASGEMVAVVREQMAIIDPAMILPLTSSESPKWLAIMTCEKEKVVLCDEYARWIADVYALVYQRPSLADNAGNELYDVAMSMTDWDIVRSEDPTTGTVTYIESSTYSSSEAAYRCVGLFAKIPSFFASSYVLSSAVPPVMYPRYASMGGIPAADATLMYLVPNGSSFSDSDFQRLDAMDGISYYYTSAPYPGISQFVSSLKSVQNSLFLNRTVHMLWFGHPYTAVIAPSRGIDVVETKDGVPTNKDLNLSSTPATLTYDDALGECLLFAGEKRSHAFPGGTGMLENEHIYSALGIEHIYTYVMRDVAAGNDINLKTDSGGLYMRKTLSWTVNAANQLSQTFSFDSSDKTVTDSQGTKTTLPDDTECNTIDYRQIVGSHWMWKCVHSSFFTNVGATITTVGDTTTIKMAPDKFYSSLLLDPVHPNFVGGAF